MVSAGDRIGIDAFDVVEYAGRDTSTGPNGTGNPTNAGESGCTWLVCGGNSIPSHSLVGRIGNGNLSDSTTGFFIGSKFNMTASSSGELYLGFNDSFVLPDRSGLNSGGVGDNSGSFITKIYVTR